MLKTPLMFINVTKDFIIIFLLLILYPLLIKQYLLKTCSKTIFFVAFINIIMVTDITWNENSIVLKVNIKYT